MHKQKARVPVKAKQSGTHPLATNNPFLDHPNSEAARTWELLNNGHLTSDKLTLMGANGTIDVTMFYLAFGVVANPLHPDNNWRSVVEKMAIGKDVYYRLATEIPISVMEYWKKHGHPPACGWDIFDPNASFAIKASVQEYLEKVPPAKPARMAPAKKAKPVAENIPAKSNPTESSYKGTPVANLLRHPKNPFRPGSGYGLLVDIIASERLGIHKQALLSMYRIFASKTEAQAGFDLAVIASAQRGKPRNKSCREGFFTIKQGNVYSIEFE